MEISDKIKETGRVLIVEDEEDLAVLLDYNLKKENYQVHLADNGRKALQLVEDVIPDVILLDILLPEISGWEVCRSIRQHSQEKISSIPIIMLTALQDDQDKYRGLELGADAYIKKPYAIKEVLLYCRNLASSRKRHLSLIHREDNQDFHREDLYRILFHELRSQLAVIGGFSHLLGRKADRKQESKYIQAIQRSADYLENIAGEMHILEQVCRNSDSLPREIISLKELLTEVVAMILPLACKKNIAIQLASQQNSFTFQQSKTAVKIIMSTILENAVKYSPCHSVIKVGLQNSAGNLVVSFTDHGPGISVEEQVRIFDKSYRTPEASATTSGTGLGLYIARKLAETIRGIITVHSRPGEGSTFTCILPTG